MPATSFSRFRLILLVVELFLSIYAIFFSFKTSEPYFTYLSLFFLGFVIVRRSQINLYRLFRPRQANSRPTLRLSMLQTFSFLNKLRGGYLPVQEKKKILKMIRKSKSAWRDFLNLFLDMTIAIFAAFMLSLVIKFFIIDIYRVELNSMYPTLEPEQKVVVEKISMGILDPFFFRNQASLPQQSPDEKWLAAVSRKLPNLNRRAAEQTDDLPVLISYHHRLQLKVRSLQRGDILVFLAPKRNDKVLYVKRIIAVPGDKLEFTTNGDILLNNQLLDEDYLPPHSRSLPASSIFQIFPDSFRPKNKRAVFSVPEDHFYVMGDNRASSQDSRNWGFVPKQNIVGRVIYKIPK